MISIIICSVNKTLLQQLTDNIRTTAGLAYEIIAIDNSIKQEGICSVYNKGGRRARFDILCFLHEDILFETPNWGLLVQRHLEDRSVGLTGVAGGDIRGLVPSSWSTYGRSAEINIIQHFDKNDKKEARRLSVSKGGFKPEVVCLDGVMLCTRKEVFKEFFFDEQLLKGFHGYDMDYSLQVGTKYRLAVMHNVLIRHYSTGNPDRQWIESAISISRKWKARLPVSVGDFSEEELIRHHWKALQVFLQQLMRLGFNQYQVIYYYLYYSRTRFFTVRRFLSMGKYLIHELFNQQQTGGEPSPRQMVEMANAE